MCPSSSPSSCTSYAGSCVDRPSDYPKTATEWDYLAVPIAQDVGGSWSDINSICVDRGLQLCSSGNFCTDRIPPSGIDIPDGDSWIAVGDAENEWFTFRRGWGDRICKTHTEVAGSKPGWGTTTCTGSACAMRRGGICCGTCSSSSCDASGAITNGAPGSGCTSTLADGATCTPTCNSGYTLSGSRSCSSGTLTDTAVCNPDPSPSSPYDFTDCCGTKLKHWFDFSDTSVYGSSEVTKISGFTDKMGNSASTPMNGNVQYKSDVQNGLGAMFTRHEAHRCCSSALRLVARTLRCIVASRVVCQQSCDRGCWYRRWGRE